MRRAAAAFFGWNAGPGERLCVGNRLQRREERVARRERAGEAIDFRQLAQRQVRRELRRRRDRWIHGILVLRGDIATVSRRRGRLRDDVRAVGWRLSETIRLACQSKGARNDSPTGFFARRPIALADEVAYILAGGTVSPRRSADTNQREST